MCTISMALAQRQQLFANVGIGDDIMMTLCCSVGDKKPPLLINENC